jgi:signal transduction histidine kinase
MLLLSFFIYYFASRNTFQSFYHRMDVRAKIVAQASLEKNKSNTRIYFRVKEEQLEDLPFEKDYFLQLKPGTKQLETKPALPLPAYFYERTLQEGAARYSLGGTFYVGHYPGKGHNFIVVTSAQDIYGMEELKSLKRVLTTGFLVFTILVFTTGKLFSRQIFAPIRKIVQNVQQISASNLHLRLDTGNGRDEVSELAVTFNNMLSRLETTFESQNNFISNASHEFRTPLTIISGEAELGIQKAASPEIAASFRLILSESERLDHLVSSLLSLAQTGFDGKKMQWEPIRIDELLWSVKTTADQIYPENKVCLDFSNLPDDAEQLTTEGSMTLLKLAFSNVVLNACKYSDNKKVVVQLISSRKVLTVKVTDQGIGIPRAELPQVFVPFFRASNTGDYEGYGIGLPLTLNIIRLHKGSIEIDAKEMQGTVVSIHLPIKINA